ncbi:fumarylacetoacetate hydrolase family protein [Nocardioides sp. Bht2]|uniref:fumarylacetoacetate hydrolase family protein n=1 Tax=Nocardioides sp. Bht2 TaxID=3392297 RepID=UPI0039B5DB95
MKLASVSVPSGRAVVVAALGTEPSYLLDVEGYRRHAAAVADAPLAETDRLAPTMRDLLAGGSAAMAEVATLVAAAAAQVAAEGVESLAAQELVVAESEVVFQAPVPNPGKMIFAGRNYRAHREEVGLDEDRGEAPTFFAKYPSTLTGHATNIEVPWFSDQIDYEIELAVVIGTQCRDVEPRDALGVVAGYTVTNDVSARNFQLTEKNAIFLGKNFDTAAPMGPWLVTADEVGDPTNLDIECRVDGEVRQQGNTSSMLWSIAELIAYASRLTLEPGDIVSTGTTNGCAYGQPPGAERDRLLLRPGQVLESEISGVGLLRNPIADS